MSDLYLVVPLSEFFNNSSDGYKYPERRTQFATFPNIPGQQYVIGSDYPGEIGNEEFIYHQWEGFTAKIQCKFSVKGDGLYTISEGTPGVSKTFVNRRMLDGPLVLNDKDSISFGKPRSFGEKEGCPVFLVRFKIKSPEMLPSVATRRRFGAGPIVGSSFEEHLLNNDVVLTAIFQYCDIQDLKRSRLVCHKWNQFVKPQLEKRGTVAFDFDKSYAIPRNSMRLFNYLRDTQDFKIMNLKVQFNSGEYSKWKYDFVKLLNAEKYTSLILNTDVGDTESFANFLFILDKLGDNLKKLEFGEDFLMTYIPEGFNTFEFSFKSLKKFAHIGETRGQRYDQFLERWISDFIQKISKTLEEFACCGDISPVYIEEIVKAKPKKLKRLAIISDPYGTFSPELHHLLQIRTKLTTLILETMKIRDQECASQLEELLRLHARSLIRLHIAIDEVEEPIDILIPKFPNLQEFRFQYSRNVRIQWESGSLDYSVNFPVLRRLEVLKCHEFSRTTIDLNQHNANEPFEWEQDGSVFSEFFPAAGEFVCKTVTKLVIRTLRKREEVCGEEYKRYQLRLFKISDMLPEVQLKAVESFGFTAMECNNDKDKQIVKTDCDDVDDFIGFCIPEDQSDYDEPCFPCDDTTSESSDNSF